MHCTNSSSYLVIHSDKYSSDSSCSHILVCPILRLDKDVQSFTPLTWNRLKILFRGHGATRHLHLLFICCDSQLLLLHCYLRMVDHIICMLPKGATKHCFQLFSRQCLVRHSCSMPLIHLVSVLTYSLLSVNIHSTWCHFHTVLL